MKVLQINCVYNTGSTGKILYDIHIELLNSGAESVICYGRGAKTTDDRVYKTCGELYSKFNNLLTRFTGLMYGGCFFSTNKLISIIKKENPDIVHLHCINGYFVNIYRLITWLKNNKIKTVLTLHAEFMHTANCVHAFECDKWKTGCGNCPRFKRETKSLIFDKTALSFKKMKRAFCGFEDLTVVSVSDWLMERAKLSPILEGKNHTVVLNGVNTSAFKYSNAQDLRERLNLSKGKVVLFVTPSFSLDPNHPKGGYYVSELAKMLPDVNFVVVGNKNKDLILPENVIDVGRVENMQELAEFYSMADVTLLASKKETFSLVVAESLCCGTPVVGFKAGAPETITIPEYSSFTEYGDVDTLKTCLQDFLANEWKPVEISVQASEKYDNKKMTERYLEIYSNLLGETLN